jgi:hypothetical protein
MDIRTILAKNYINFRGWKSNRKIVVIESDDWGSIRIANQGVVDKALVLNPSFGNNKFLLYDGLEREADVELLLGVLAKHKDFKGNSPVVTALALTSNPNIELMKKGKEEFSYISESISETYEKYGENKLLSKWKNEGINTNLLYPQFHGKQHLFVNRYIKRINNSQDVENFAFLNDSIFGIANTSRALNFMSAFEYQNEFEKKIIEQETKDGLEQFKKLFGFHSKSFCPSQSIYGDHVFPILKSNGVKTIQAGQQFVPYKNSLDKVDNLWGKRTKEGLFFTRRNCTFETYKNRNFDHIDSCLSEIEIAFRWGKPAVINSHRINFTSRIRCDLRDKTLNDLDILIKRLIKRWPTVEFVNSAELADLIEISAGQKVN